MVSCVLKSVDKIPEGEGIRLHMDEVVNGQAEKHHLTDCHLCTSTFPSIHLDDLPRHLHERTVIKTT